MNEGFREYIDQAEKKLEEYKKMRDNQFLLSASRKTWMAFREIIIDKAGLERSDFLHDTVIKHNASKLQMYDLWKQAHYLNMVYSSAASSNRNGTIKRIKSFIKKTKKYGYEKNGKQDRGK